MLWEAVGEQILSITQNVPNSSCFSFPQKVVVMNATQESGPALGQGIAFQLGKSVMELQTALQEKMKLTPLRADIAVCIRIKSMYRTAETAWMAPVDFTLVNIDSL